MKCWLLPHGELLDFLEARDDEPLLVTKHHSHHLAIAFRHPEQIRLLNVLVRKTLEIFCIPVQYTAMLSLWNDNVRLFTYLCITLYGNLKQRLSNIVIVMRDPQKGNDVGPKCWRNDENVSWRNIVFLRCIDWYLHTWDFVLVEFPCPEGKNDNKKQEKQHFKEQLYIFLVLAANFYPYSFTFALWYLLFLNLLSTLTLFVQELSWCTSALNTTFTFCVQEKKYKFKSLAWLC